MQAVLVGRESMLADALALLDRRDRGLLLYGAAGVGKTRLLAEILDRLVDKGWYVERFVATEATQDVPLGALISLLPNESSDRVQLIAGVRQKLFSLAGGRPAAIAVDDAHLLDPVTLACLVDLAHHSDITVLGTARSTEPMPPALTELWASEAADRVVVEPLDRSETVQLAARLLTGGVSDALAEELWERTAGVPLLVRELLLDGLGAGTITAAGGTWTISGPLMPGDRLHELVRSRLDRLDEGAVATVELIATAEPIRLDLLTEPEVARIDSLTEARLVRSEVLAGALSARIEHPLIAAAIIGSMPAVRRRDHLRTVATRIVDGGCRAPGDALRVTRLLADAGDPVDPDILIVAGREAIRSLDLDRAAELADASIETRPLEGHLVLGEARRLQARAAEAERALAVAAGLAGADETIVRVAMWRSTLRAHHLDDPAGAMGLLNEAAERVSDQVRALELRSEAAFLAGILGHFDVAVSTNREILATEGLDIATRWTATMNQLFGQVMLADVTGIDALLDDMRSMMAHGADVRPEGIDLFWGLYAAALTMTGELERCERELVDRVHECVANDEIHGLTAAIFSHTLLMRGSARTLAIAEAAITDLATSDAYLVAPIAQAAYTITVAATGDLEAATAALHDVDASHTNDLRLRSFVERARAAVAVLSGRPDDGAEIAAAAGKECVAGTYVYMGALALYDAVRYGRADLTAESLALAAAAHDAPLIDACAAHAIAQRDRDGVALDRAGRRLCALGAAPFGAAAFADAARCHDDAYAAARSATAAALVRRAIPLHNALDRADPPALTAREIDIVAAALGGDPSRVVAERLFLSTRTVDNHLARAYRKLGVSGRDELAVVFGPLTT